MAIQATQLTNAITASQTSFAVLNGALSSLPVVGALPLPYGVPVQIDGEIMYAISQPVANQLVVRGRGSDGTASSAHDTLANVYTSSTPGDFPLPSPGTLVSIDIAQDLPISIGQDSTIVVPNTNTIYNINKNAAAAITLTAPNLAQNGCLAVFTSNTAFAHVITAGTTGGFQDGSGVARNTFTFTAQKGATVRLIAENGFWNTDGAPQNVTAA